MSEVKTPAGTFPIIHGKDGLLVQVGKRSCKSCGIDVCTMGDGLLGFGWTTVFVRECYDYCCACCPHGHVSPCPKELNQERLQRAESTRRK